MIGKLKATGDVMLAMKVPLLFHYKAHTISQVEKQQAPLPGASPYEVLLRRGELD